MINPTYISFEQAKKLKEKGFDVEVKTVFKNKDGWEEAIGVPYNYNRFENIQSAPEQWQVVEWLRVNHGIWISIYLGHDQNKIWYNVAIEKIELGSNHEPMNNHFDIDGFTPQEAYSQAFDYILNNLI
jgi:hypothetical protein